MGEDPDAEADIGGVDTIVTERIGRRLDGNPRFDRVDIQPAAAPNSIVAEYDLGCFPAAISRAYLQIRWYETDDFSIHYAEQYDDSSWECRWDRHPNGHNTRSHFHPPPDADTPADDVDFPVDWRDVVTAVLSELDDRIEAFWDSH